MTVFDKMDTSYEAWKPYHEKSDILEPTHSVVSTQGPLGLYCVAIELPTDKKLVQLGKWMNKEVDTATRFSLTDGRIQVEIEVWDGDFAKRLYFAGDLSLKQCIQMIKSKHFAMGFCPVGTPNVTVASVQMFRKEDLVEMVRIKKMTDSHPKRPSTWKVG
jgi:hypothetical protein